MVGRSQSLLVSLIDSALSFQKMLNKKETADSFADSSRSKKYAHRMTGKIGHEHLSELSGPQSQSAIDLFKDFAAAIPIDAAQVDLTAPGHLCQHSERTPKTLASPCPDARPQEIALR
jgi:hypothetical protein